MGRKPSYNQFCPVAKGAEVFAERWTPLILRELMLGSHRFNDLRRGLPKISQSVLSQRLKELEWAGIVERRAPNSGPGWEYFLTPSGEEMWPVVEQLGIWAYRWFQVEITKDDLDATLLMIDMRRGIKPENLPTGKVVIQFFFPDAPSGSKRWWLVFDRGDADLCSHDPGFPVDLFLESSLLTMTQIWMGDMSFKHALRTGGVQVDGASALVGNLPGWIGVSFFGTQERQK